MIELLVPEHLAYLTHKRGEVRLLPEVQEWLEEAIPDAVAVPLREFNDMNCRLVYPVSDGSGYIYLGFFVLKLPSETDAVLWRLRWE